MNQLFGLQHRSRTDPMIQELFLKVPNYLSHFVLRCDVMQKFIYQDVTIPFLLYYYNKIGKAL